MRFALAIVFLLLTIAGPANAESPVRQYVVVLPKLPLGARLTSFDLRINGGQVATLKETPAGWTITINNDPSWNDSLKGQSAPAKFIPPSAQFIALATIGASLTNMPGSPARARRARMIWLAGRA